MDSNNIFLNHVELLTSKRIEGARDIVNISQKYHSLFSKEQKDFNISLGEVTRLINDILSRVEEYGENNLDKWGRFDRNKSFLVQNELDQSPIIDELILDVFKQLGLKVRNIWPPGKKAAVCLTHDVDSISGLSHLWLRQANWYSRLLYFKAKKNREGVDKWLSTIRKWRRFKEQKVDPVDAFDRLQELESRFGFRSTFYFMSLSHELSRAGRKYSVKNPRLIQVTRELLEGRWEVGLHAAYHNNLSLNSLKKQKQRLEEVIQAQVTGCRHHYLRVRFPQSWALYAQAGFNYSSNLGWGGGFNGFRAGTCLPYQPLKEECSLWEIPFQMMDQNPLLNQEEYLRTFSKYLSHAKKVGGCLVLNFHQEHMNEEVAPGVGEVYRDMLETISKDKDVTVLTMNEVWSIVNDLAS